MFIGGVNFSLHFLAWRHRRVSNYFRDPEFRTYTRILVVSIVLYALVLWLTRSCRRPGAGAAARAVSGRVDADHLGIRHRQFLALAGRAAGHSDAVRVHRRLRRIDLRRHESRALAAHLEAGSARSARSWCIRAPNCRSSWGNKPIDMRVIDAVWGFFAVYVIAFGVLMVLLMATGEDQVTAFSAIAACMTNTGTGLGEVAANFTIADRRRQMDLRAGDAARPSGSLSAAGADLADVLATVRRNPAQQREFFDPMRIEDYALIGDCETAALVGRDGSIDWLCWPRFDSDACFAALLGNSDHGRWLIQPVDAARISRCYRTNTLILETRFTTDTGSVLLVDFMPPRGQKSDVMRLVIGETGRVRMRTELVVRFGYGAVVPWVTRPGERSWKAVAGPEMVFLRTPVVLRGENLHSVAQFDVDAGEMIPFTLTYSPSHLPAPSRISETHALEQTEHFWKQWASRCDYGGHRRDAVVRSLITLRALIYAPTGGMVAAPTTSLPEKSGGPRNWDVSLLLAARCDAHLAGADECGLLDGSRRMARLAGAGGRRQSVANADHVRGCRRAASHRMAGAMAARLRGVQPGADR